MHLVFWLFSLLAMDILLFSIRIVQTCLTICWFQKKTNQKKERFKAQLIWFGPNILFTLPEYCSIFKSFSIFWINFIEYWFKRTFLLKWLLNPLCWSVFHFQFDGRSNVLTINMHKQSHVIGMQYVFYLQIIVVCRDSESR